MIAAIYARKSTDQSGVSDDQKSVARQAEHAAAYAVSKGWTVDERFVFVDDGISGAEFTNRPGFLRLMNALKPRAPFQVLVMSEESRLGREAIETAYALKQLITAGVRVFFYLEDRERTLDSPTDKIMLSLTAFADELEREKARQRTSDAMLRKARAGHVTGGRVFGYDNIDVLGPDGKRSHVERRINTAEAVVVRQIFTYCADGLGVKRIAIALNDAGAPSPRAQQHRPHGWAPSSVREVLHRELYRGEVTYNRTQKRDRWGRKRQAARPESDWLRQTVTALRIVSDEDWAAAHARLKASSDTYLRGTAGQLWGRPMTGLGAKYLLVGLARCGTCGGGMLVKSRAHGRRRSFRYGCSSYHLRGRSVCTNGVDLPMDEAHAEILDAVEQDILAPDVVDMAIAEALATVTAPTSTEKPDELQRGLRAVEGQIRNLTAALAAGGDMASLVDALREREHDRARVERQLAAYQHARVVDPQRIEGELRERMTAWREMFGRHVQLSRQALQKLLLDKIVCTVKDDGGGRYYELRARLSFGRIFSGILCPSGMASPSIPSWNQILAWLREMQSLRESANHAA
jgi:DNA invertase Pin-like site-specific DNA recombinase